MASIPFSPDTTLPWLARWEGDDTRTRVVTARCKRCSRYLRWGAVVGVVSPSGIEHWADGERTACGIDATGEEWWWPV